jgi:SIR2-like domain
MAEELSPESQQRVVEELESFAALGQRRWQFLAGSSLTAIEGLMAIRRRIDDEPSSRSAIVAQAIETACKALSEPWAPTALAHFGFAPEAPDARGGREEMAADCLGWSLRTYQGTAQEGRHNGRRYEDALYESYAKLTITLVAKQLMSEAGGEPRRPPKPSPTAQVGTKPPLFIEDSNKPVFRRDGIEHYLDALAATEKLTIFAGAGVSADIGLPLHEDLMPAVLKQIATQLKIRGRRLPGIPDDDDLRKERLNAVIKGIQRGSSVYLGSIAHELAAIGAKTAEAGHRRANEWLVRAIEEIIAERTLGTEGGFLARGVAALAFAMVDAKGSAAAQIMTTNYDSTFISEAQEKVHHYFPEFADYTFAPIMWSTADAADRRPDIRTEQLLASYEAARESKQEVPLYYANGQLEHGDTIVAAELDFLVQADTDDLDKARQSARETLLLKALEETDSLFVGSSVTDPDMLARLAQTKGNGRMRYALLLAPPTAIRQGDNELTLDPAEAATRAEAEQQLAREFTAARFRHLGITPITLDFACQVPQFLREVALKVQTSHRRRTYRSYGDRLANWWQKWHTHLGFPVERSGEPGPRPLLMQLAWQKMLADVRDKTITPFLKDNAPGKKSERIMVEVWLRNPRLRDLDNPPLQAGVRSLFLWASSESLWLAGDTAHWGPVSIKAKDHYVAQEAFREGRTVIKKLEPKRGHWKYCVSMPLILHEEPWYHLPIGVVNVLSDISPPETEIGGIAQSDTNAESRLYSITQGITAREDALSGSEIVGLTKGETFEDAVKSRINNWFDTEEPSVHLHKELLEALAVLESEASLYEVDSDGHAPS